MESHKVLNTMETTSIPIPSLKSHTTTIKRLNDKRILVKDAAPFLTQTSQNSQFSHPFGGVP